MSTMASVRESQDRRLFDQIASSYALKDMTPANQLARELRLQQTLSRLPFGVPLHVLEIGCGAGYTARYLKDTFQSYLGVDYSEELIKFARHRNSFPGATFLSANARDLPTNLKFDVVLMIGVVHHMDSPMELLVRLRHHLNPGGYLLVNEPQGENPVINLLRRMRKRVDGSYSEDQVEYSHGDLADLIRHAGYIDVRTYAQGFCSTPLAEVVFPARRIMAMVSRMACAIDRTIEKRQSRLLARLAWNVIAVGKAQDPSEEQKPPLD